jgi:hypothetical protein
MNTFNLLNAIALLACISTPAYVLYYLKYFVGENQKKQTSTINSIESSLFSLESKVEKIQFDEIEKRVEHLNELHDLNKLIDHLEINLKMQQSMSDNNFDNINVQLDYLRRTLDKNINELKNEVTKAVDHSNLNAHAVFSKLDNLENDVDGLQSLNMTTQSILNRINSKEFAREVLLAGMNMTKENAVEAKVEEKKVKEKKKSTSTKPTESVKSEVVNIIKDEVPVEEIVDKKPRKPKKDSKRVIRNRELEVFFKEQTKLTYRGFVIKHGEDAFKREKQLVYKRLYYNKFMKPNLNMHEQKENQLKMSIYA